MHGTALAAAVALLAVARAAGPTNSFNSSDLETLNTSSSSYYVDQTTRNAWCTSQRSACSLLCGGVGGFDANDCDANALTWNCTCSSNHSAPGLQWYTTTMPYNLCNHLNGECMAVNAPNGLAAQENCNATYVCGDLNITAFSSPSASASASSASTASSTASPSPSSSKSAAVAALHVGEHYGAGLLGAGLVAALGYLL